MYFLTLWNARLVEFWYIKGVGIPLCVIRFISMTICRSGIQRGFFKVGGQSTANLVCLKRKISFIWAAPLFPVCKHGSWIWLYELVTEFFSLMIIEELFHAIWTGPVVCKPEVSVLVNKRDAHSWLLSVLWKLVWIWFVLVSLYAEWLENK